MLMLMYWTKWLALVDCFSENEKYHFLLVFAASCSKKSNFKLVIDDVECACAGIEDIVFRKLCIYVLSF